VIGQDYSVRDALRKATRVLKDHRERNPVTSVMLSSNTIKKKKFKLENLKFSLLKIEFKILFF